MLTLWFISNQRLPFFARNLHVMGKDDSACCNLSIVCICMMILWTSVDCSVASVIHLLCIGALWAPLCPLVSNPHHHFARPSSDSPDQFQLSFMATVSVANWIINIPLVSLCVYWCPWGVELFALSRLTAPEMAKVLSEYSLVISLSWVSVAPNALLPLTTGCWDAYLPANHTMRNL